MHLIFPIQYPIQTPHAKNWYQEDDFFHILQQLQKELFWLCSSDIDLHDYILCHQRNINIKLCKKAAKIRFLTENF